MDWKKYSIGFKLSFLIPTFSILIIFFSFYSSRNLLFIIGIILGLYFLVCTIFEKNFGKRLTLINEKKQVIALYEQETNWEITIRNEGFPIIGAYITVVFDKNVLPLQKANLEVINSYRIEIPFSIGINQEITVKIPVRAVKRGLARIRSIEIVAPQIFGFEKTILEYNKLILQEILVYPKVSSIGNMHFLESMKQGDVPVKQSIFFNYLSPVGSRDYVFSDSFKQINWKATAKLQKLQTKVYETIADSGIHFNMNVSENYSINRDLELYIEQLAFMIYTLEKKSIPYSLMINFRTHGQMSFYHLPRGLGKKQLQSALRTLAIMDQILLSYPFDSLLGYYYKHMNTEPYVIHIGNLTDTSLAIYQKMQKQGTTILQLNNLDENGRLEYLTGGRK